MKFQDTSKPISELLSEIKHSLTDNHVTLRQVSERIGEQGLLIFCVILTIPFLLPASIPGTSTVLGLLILLIGLGIMANRIPWLPDRLMSRQIASEHMHHILDNGHKLFTRLDKFLRPRLHALTHGPTVNRFNGLMLVVAALLLMVPGLIPFSNMLPGWAILMLALGMLQRDGLFIMAGYALVVATIAYFGAIVLVAAGGIHALLADTFLTLSLF